ncbi:MAG TPA: nuclear transport factor 2 family protein [Patescibacteria group bacterium]|jgi:hypothetical protein|nr:nuclear transport factor 2 family protein [Patescibacteria group bacterium]
MTKEQFEDWLKKLINVWEPKNPNGVLDLVAEKFLWYETPFDDLITTKEKLLQEWQTVLDQDDIKVTYEILSLENNIGIAHWHATFTRLSSGEKAELDGIYKVILDENGKCTEFHQWYNSK